LPASEYNALYELYTATDGSRWDWRNLTRDHIPWNFTPAANPCIDLWQGIDCVTVGEPPFARSHLLRLSLRSRNLSGTLPDSIGAFPHLELIDLPRNNITGTLPASMNQLGQLLRLEMDYNKFSGPIPEAWCNLTTLRVFILSKNQLTGTLPQDFAKLDKLGILYLNSNYLRGTIPLSLGNMTKLSYLDLDTNLFTGTIPHTFANLSHMHFFGLHSNALTGTLPAFIGDWRGLEFVYLNNAKFTGTIPASYGHLPLLSFLHLQYNQLTGTVPAALGNLPKLEYLYLSDNRLTGTLPAALSQLRQITSMLLQGNRLHGNLHHIFNHTVQHRLTTIQFSNNMFTGTLPEEMFRLPKLTTVVMVSNCLRGTLPSNVCTPAKLETLVLDGLQSASSCKGFTIPGFNVAAQQSRYFSGPVPACLFNMPHLNTLHLSGNSLSGGLPKGLVVSNHLVDLDLSHNVLSGEIPAAIQTKVWYNLALSYNRFRGSLRHDFFLEERNLSFTLTSDHLVLEVYNITFPRSSSALNLENNRLSGVLPQSIKPIVNISVLQGNIFSCAIGKGDLPKHDKGEDTYQCGSNSFDLPFYTWLVLASVACITAAALWYWRSRLDKYVGVFETVGLWHKWLVMLTQHNGLPASINQRLMNISYVSDVAGAICRVTLWSAGFILFVLLPLYAVVSSLYGTHKEQYTYTVSSAFEAGEVPFAVQMAEFGVFMLCFGAGFSYYMSSVDAKRGVHHTRMSTTMDVATTQEKNMVKKAASRLERLSVRFAFFAINLIVVLGANIAFVYIALYESSVLLIIAQVLMSIFKFMWNTVCAPFFIRWTAHYLASSHKEVQRESKTSFFSLQLFVALFNNIAIPCLVVGVVDPSCFYNAIVPAQSETSHYVFAECKVYAVVGCLKVVPEIASASYDPPFAYSYQCSSSFITYYAPTFVYVCLVATLVAPVTQLAAQKIHAYINQDTLLFRALDFCLPPVLKPLQHGPLTRNVFKPYFDANLVLVTLLTYLGVMLTFGAVFPPLGIALAVTIFFVAYFAKLKIGRLITNVISEGLFGYLDIIQAECQGVGSVRKLKQSVWMLVSFSCGFYTLFLFDTLGNKVGFRRAAWVLIVVPLTPLIAYCAVRLYTYTVGHALFHNIAGAKSVSDVHKDADVREVELRQNNTPFASKVDVVEGSTTVNILVTESLDVEEGQL